LGSKTGQILEGGDKLKYKYILRANRGSCKTDTRGVTGEGEEIRVSRRERKSEFREGGFFQKGEDGLHRGEYGNLSDTILRTMSLPEGGGLKPA